LGGKKKKKKKKNPTQKPKIFWDSGGNFSDFGGGGALGVLGRGDFLKSFLKIFFFFQKSIKKKGGKFVKKNQNFVFFRGGKKTL